MALSNIENPQISYRDAAVLALEAGREMLSRLQLIKLDPGLILNIGYGSSLLSEDIKQIYPKARLVDLNVQHSALPEAVSEALLHAEAESLPFEDKSVDFIFANFILPWQDQFEQSLKEWRRVLKPNGLLMLTALGPESFAEYLKELQEAIIPKGIDMHDLGDLLMHAGFSDPVLDVCPYSLAYQQADKMMNELAASYLLKADVSAVTLSPSEGDKYVISFEVIHAHAFAPANAQKEKRRDDGAVSIPVSEIKRRA